jgi:hypothetical protein
MGLPLDNALRETPPEDATDFVADVWRKSGWESSSEGPVITATRAGESRQLLVCHDESADADADVDAVVSTGDDDRAGALAERCGAELVGATDLYRRLAYGMPVAERERLIERHLDVESVSDPDSGENTAETVGSGKSESTTEDGIVADTTDTDAGSTATPFAGRGDSARGESDEDADASSEASRVDERAATHDSPPDRDQSTDGRDESDRTANGIRITRRVAATTVLLGLLAVGSVIAFGVLPGLQASAGEPATTDAADLPTTDSENVDRDTLSSVTTAPDRDGQRRYVGLAPTCNRPPGLVITIQLGALQQNDETLNNGIRTVWQFASPENQRRIGRYSEFERIVNSSRYQVMFEYARAEYAPIQIENGSARQRVTLTTPNGSTATYEFHLSKQSGGEHDGCWMTDGVVRVDENAAAARQ